MGCFDAILTEGADHILGYRSPNFVYRPRGCRRLKLLLKNYSLSDDIAFRFSNRHWAEWPLTAEKFAHWVNAINGNGHVVNLFMDYETFGEHQWEDTGIFDFMRHLPDEILKHPDNNFKTPSEVAAAYEPLGVVDVPHMISWADTERDLSAWLGNPMQSNALHELYRLEKKSQTDQRRRKSCPTGGSCKTSDHFYYMCTKYFADGDVHKYFNPYDSPYDSYINFMNVLDHLQRRCARHEPVPERSGSYEPDRQSRLAVATYGTPAMAMHGRSQVRTGVHGVKSSRVPGTDASSYKENSTSASHEKHGWGGNCPCCDQRQED